VIAGLLRPQRPSGTRSKTPSDSRLTAVGAVRREDVPAADKRFSKAGIRPGILRAGHGVRRHEMHVVRQMGRHVGHHLYLDRAYVGHDRARRQMGRNLPRRGEE
jgi:hypothetical protein